MSFDNVSRISSLESATATRVEPCHSHLEGSSPSGLVSNRAPALSLDAKGLERDGWPRMLKTNRPSSTSRWRGVASAPRNASYEALLVGNMMGTTCALETHGRTSRRLASTPGLSGQMTNHSHGAAVEAIVRRCTGYLRQVTGVRER